jgi:hypothetical protein
MTLVEFHDAVEGFYELENERNENYLEGVRLVAYYAAAPHQDPAKSGLWGPENILKLKKDKLRRSNDLIPVVIEVIPKENGKQSNG